MFPFNIIMVDVSQKYLIFWNILYSYMNILLFRHKISIYLSQGLDF